MHYRTIIWTRQQSACGLRGKKCNGECWQKEEMSEQEKSTKTRQIVDTIESFSYQIREVLVYEV